MIQAPRSFGYYLKTKRQQLGLSQADLADKTGVQRTSISRLESPSGNPQWTMIRTLAERGMEIPVSELFQVEPVEARQPVIQIGADVPGGKLTELLIKTQGKPVPVVSDITPLRAKVITDKDLSGYCVLDNSLIRPYEALRLVAVSCQEAQGECSWLIVDLEDRAIEDQGVFLVCLDDKLEPRRAWLSPKGGLILEPLGRAGAAPVAFWGRQKDRVEVLGRVVMTASVFRHKPGR